MSAFNNLILIERLQKISPWRNYIKTHYKITYDTIVTVYCYNEDNSFLLFALGMIITSSLFIALKLCIICQQLETSLKKDKYILLIY